jgi:hypothetical protein
MNAWTRSLLVVIAAVLASSCSGAGMAIVLTFLVALLFYLPAMPLEVP